MAYILDPEIATVFAAMAEQGNPVTVPERGDWKVLRKIANGNLSHWASLMSSDPDVSIRYFFITAPDGAMIECRWYEKKESSPCSAVVYAHGGGMIAGDLDMYDPVVSEYVSLSGVPFLSVNYRLAPEARGNMMAEDLLSGISWLIKHSSEFSVDLNRIAIMGDSGGGGVAAGAAILARDRRISLARQILIYPMLDDRNLKPDPLIEPFLTWTYNSNFTGWSAVLGDDLGTDNVSAISAPARCTNFKGLPPTYIEVGDLDIFRNEDISYAGELARAGIPVEMHIHPGAPHGYDRLAPHSKLARQAMADRIRVIKSI